MRCGTIIPCSEWPARDKALWDVGVRPTTILDGSGVAARWRARTAESYEFAYGRWLGWLKETNQLDPELASGTRVNRDRLRAYIVMRRAEEAGSTINARWNAAQFRDAFQVALLAVRPFRIMNFAEMELGWCSPEHNEPATVLGRVLGLERALAVIAPDFDRGLLRVAINKLPRGSDPARKRAVLQESAALVDLGITLNLVHRGDAWWLVYAPEETKNHRSLEVPFPEALLPWLARYLDHYRPLLAGNRYRGGRVWVSMHYRALWRGTIYQKIMWLTEKAFGRGLSPHLFRDCLATSLAIHDPAIVNIAHVMLGNPLATTERFYNLAQTLEAGRAVNRALTSLRDRLLAKGL